MAEGKEVGVLLPALSFMSKQETPVECQTASLINSLLFIYRIFSLCLPHISVFASGIIKSQRESKQANKSHLLCYGNFLIENSQVGSHKTDTISFMIHFYHNLNTVK